jgi:protein phosphatase
MKESLDNIQIPPNKNALIVVIGPPASGKSTWSKSFAQKVGAKYVSTDAIRAEFGKGEGDQSINPFGAAIGRVRNALTQGRHVVIDATNINRSARKTFTKIADEFGAYKIAIAFEVPREELLKRDAQRDRHVGPEVIDRYIKDYRRPDETEFDKVVIKH